jgi:hypothetical protein
MCNLYCNNKKRKKETMVQSAAGPTYLINKTLNA